VENERKGERDRDRSRDREKAIRQRDRDTRGTKSKRQTQRHTVRDKKTDRGRQTNKEQVRTSFKKQFTIQWRLHKSNSAGWRAGPAVFAVPVHRPAASRTPSCSGEAYLCSTKNLNGSQALVAHASNPSYSGSKHQEDPKPAQANSSQDAIGGMGEWTGDSTNWMRPPHVMEAICFILSLLI
jgi:hypothetical protein